MRKRRARKPQPLVSDIWRPDPRWPLTLEAQIQWWTQDIDKIDKRRSLEFMKKHFASLIQPDHMKRLLTKHGLYARSFFRRGWRNRVLSQIQAGGIKLETVWKLVRAVWGYSYPKIVPGLCYAFIREQTFLISLKHALENGKTRRAISKWYEGACESRKCFLCGSKFNLIEIGDGIYHGSDGCDVCCFQCPILKTPAKRNIKRRLGEFLGACGFVPLIAPDVLDVSFSSEIASARREAIYRSYGRVGGGDYVALQFGSWHEALLSTGLAPEGLIITPRGTKCLAKDGHVCLSLEEKKIDDWLYDHGVKHEKEPLYPRHSQLNPSGRRRADWRVRGVLIEYFGLVGDDKYDKKMDEKLRLAIEVGIRLIPIFRQDLKMLDAVLGRFAR